jgi:hypothetical protein
MKLAVILVVVVVAIATFLVGCRKCGPQADAEAAVARGQYQFIALLDPDGKWIYP